MIDVMTFEQHVQGTVLCQQCDLAEEFYVSQSICAQYIKKMGYSAKPRNSGKSIYSSFITTIINKSGLTNPQLYYVLRLLKYMGDKSHIVWSIFLGWILIWTS